MQIIMGRDRKAGKIVALSINRHSLTPSKERFHWHLNEFSEDACEMALSLFDRYGRLRPHLHGTFAEETDEGRLLYIQEVTVKDTYHHQGIGCKAIKILLQQLNDVLAFETWCTFAGKPFATFAKLPHAGGLALKAESNATA